MEKKKIFITGAGSGIGKEAAICLARRGHTVYASIYYQEQLEQLEEISKKEKINLYPFMLDILNEKDREKILNYDIDVYISNAAIGNSGSVAEVSVDKIRQVYETNIFSNIKCIQFALSKMIKNGKGRIVILASIAGRIPMPFLSPYCSSKAALETFGTCLRQEMKILNKLKETNIEIGIIEPGAYATGFNKEMNEKKYNWMYKNSYFLGNVKKIQITEEKIWNFLEQKPYNSIVKQYIRVVEDKSLKHRYSAPWWQVSIVQIGRILGM
ncbi:MAG: SDR family NAD(P)-dependent oxidoreductase [Clostridiaceae bacterium]|nr:SDR family NAD(P)-dependent oxidoreductase [Clostridiaceae bacterium]